MHSFDNSYDLNNILLDDSSTTSFEENSIIFCEPKKKPLINTEPIPISFFL